MKQGMVNKDPNQEARRDISSPEEGILLKMEESSVH